MTVIEQKVKVTQAQNMRQLIQSWHYWAKGTVALYFGTMLLLSIVALYCYSSSTLYASY